MYKNSRMPSHIDLDEALVREVTRLGHFTTKKAAVNAALAACARLLQRRQLLDQRGKASWEGDLNEMRSRPTR